MAAHGGDPTKLKWVEIPYVALGPATVAEMGRCSYGPKLLASDLQPSIDFCARNDILDASVPANDMIFTPK
jgi:hypothetical protein